MKKNSTSAVLVFIICGIMLAGCSLPAKKAPPLQLPATAQAVAGTPTHTPFLPATREPNAPIFTPTPNPPANLPTQRMEAQTYIVQAGDTLGKIAQAYQVSIYQLVATNNIINPNLLEVGTLLTIPPQTALNTGTSFKIIPDSELVYGPFGAIFDARDYILQSGGYLATHAETVDGENWGGTRIVQRVAYEYSVNPKILLALLEYRSNWLSTSRPDDATKTYPLGFFDYWRTGLYRQLAWAANELNRGYYLWKVSAVSVWTLADGTVVNIDPTINAGTAAVQYLMSLFYGQDEWNQAVSAQGVFAAYERLFGYPFDVAYEPLIPSPLIQPALQLPFEKGDMWSFTGGPHGGWADGSAWAALDFAPSDDLGCYTSSFWVTAVADGMVVRSDAGMVVLDLDKDGIEQTGWVILYAHIATEDRVKVGTVVKAGDRIGHPSCEGGVSTGLHLHIARRYNGEWIAADGDLPFNLDGWVSSGDYYEYGGFLIKNGTTIEAWDTVTDFNQISR